MIQNKKHSIGYFLELAKKDGFEGESAFKRWNDWRKQNGKIANYTKIDKERNEKIAKNAGYKSLGEYNLMCRERWATDKGYASFSEYVRDHSDIWARNKGYDSNNERRNKRDWENGKRIPMSENEDCSLYFGVVKGEEVVKRYFETVFEYVEKLNPTHRWFDFLCRNPTQEFISMYGHLGIEKNKEYKIQTKVSSLDCYNCLCFSIKYNQNVDFFILIGFDNRDNLNTVNMWLIGKEEMIRARELKNGRGYIITTKSLWNRSSLNIYMNTKSKMSYVYFDKYALTDQIDRFCKICKEFKEEVYHDSTSEMS